MERLRTFLMEDILEGTRFTAQFNFAESGSRPSTVSELLLGAGLSSETAAERFLSTSLRDSPNWGRPDLRALVSEIHPGSLPEHVLITTGTSEALFLLFRALRPRKTALIWPAFQLLYEVPASLGSSIVRLPVRWDSAGTPSFDLREWTDILQRERPDCLVLNFPHNPSGLMPSADEVTALVDAGLDVGANVIGDEHYRFLASETAPLGPSVFRLSPRVFVTGSYIKCLGCPGLRIGWCVGSNTALLAELQSEKNYTTHTVNPISEWISVELLRDMSTPIWSRHRNLWLENRRSLASFLRESRHLCGAAPQGGLVTCLGFAKARERADFDARMAAVRRADVAVLPLDSMEHAPGQTASAHTVLGRGFGFRLGLGGEAEHFRRALTVLEDACAE